jgi:hypothetical protein
MTPFQPSSSPYLSIALLKDKRKNLAYKKAEAPRTAHPMDKTSQIERRLSLSI